MYVNLIRLKSLEGDRAKAVVEALNRLKGVVAEAQPDGFVQAYLLRERRGDAAVLSIWLSRRHLRHFFESEVGKEAAKIQAELVADAVGAEEYEASWQARYAGEEVLEQLGGYK